jgi:hypothetical protein
LAVLSPAAIAAIKSGAAASIDRRSNSILHLTVALMRRGREPHDSIIEC